MVALKRENHDHSTDHVRSYDHSADHVRSYDDLRWDHRMFLKQIQRQNIWIQNRTPLLKRVPVLAPAFSLEKQNPISNRIKAHNLQICIIDINLVGLFIWLQSFQPGMPINFVNPTPHILATCTISYLAT